jgi:hypothetical protein
VIENQYGRADHDHLTRGLAYAVARRARGLVVVAEEHRDEFRAVAQYLNEMAEHDPERGVAIWLVEARAVRIGESPWAPLFTCVVEPNVFTASVEQQRQQESPLRSDDDFWDTFDDASVLDATRQVVAEWLKAGHRRRLGPNHVVLEARGPSAGGYRTVVAIYATGSVMVPFHSYEGKNSGIPVPELMSPEFRASADRLFGLTGSERLARTDTSWLTPPRVDALLDYCSQVASAYASALDAAPGQDAGPVI